MKIVLVIINGFPAYQLVEISTKQHTEVNDILAKVQLNIETVGDDKAVSPEGELTFRNETIKFCYFLVALAHHKSNKEFNWAAIKAEADEKFTQNTQEILKFLNSLLPQTSFRQSIAGLLGSKSSTTAPSHHARSQTTMTTSSASTSSSSTPKATTGSSRPTSPRPSMMPGADDAKPTLDLDWEERLDKPRAGGGVMCYFSRALEPQEIAIYNNKLLTETKQSLNATLFTDPKDKTKHFKITPSEEESTAEKKAEEFEKLFSGFITTSSTSVVISSSPNAHSPVLHHTQSPNTALTPTQDSKSAIRHTGNLPTKTANSSRPSSPKSPTTTQSNHARSYTTIIASSRPTSPQPNMAGTDDAKTTLDLDWKEKPGGSKAAGDVRYSYSRDLTSQEIAIYKQKINFFNQIRLSPTLEINQSTGAQIFKIKTSNITKFTEHFSQFVIDSNASNVTYSSLNASSQTTTTPSYISSTQPTTGNSSKPYSPKSLTTSPPHHTRSQTAADRLPVLTRSVSPSSASAKKETVGDAKTSAKLEKAVNKCMLGNMEITFTDGNSADLISFFENLPQNKDVNIANLALAIAYVAVYEKTKPAENAVRLDRDPADRLRGQTQIEFIIARQDAIRAHLSTHMSEECTKYEIVKYLDAAISEHQENLPTANANKRLHHPKK